MGRGLSALIGGTATSAETTPTPAPAAAAPTPPPGTMTVPIDRISPNPHQPRQEFAKESLRELKESIVAHGIIQPLIVRQIPPDKGAGREAPRYQIIAGERRWRAALDAGLEQVPVVIREATTEGMLELALVENIQRADLNPLEEANAYKELSERFGLTQEQVAQRVGRSRSYVANMQRLLNLPEEIIEALYDGSITAGHAIVLLQLQGAAQLQMLEEMLAEGYSVRQLQERVRRLKEPEEPPPAPPAPAGKPATPHRPAVTDANTEYLERRFSESLNKRGLSTKVQLSRSRRGGKLVISWGDEEELDHLYRVLVGQDEEDL
jgi:ParB family chromosome partitioning protein